MATTPTLRKKNAAYQSNVNKRGHVKTSLIKPKNEARLSVTYWALGLLVFALMGGAIISLLDLLI